MSRGPDAVWNDGDGPVLTEEEIFARKPGDIVITYNVESGTRDGTFGVLYSDGGSVGEKEVTDKVEEQPVLE
jgi:hypothetical protein